MKKFVKCLLRRKDFQGKFSMSNTHANQIYNLVGYVVIIDTITFKGTCLFCS